MQSIFSSPKISVITVTFNNASGLENTLASIYAQDFLDFEHIVIDGGSKDHTHDIINSAKRKVDKFISEPDVGIYHAMNKAINLAEGEWLIFMNAGDMYSAPDALSKAASLIADDVDVIYSDWIYSETGKLAKANFDKLNVRHQSIIYRKHLHDSYGNYVVGKKVSISDYIFFLSIAQKNWKYCPIPISICEQNGTSAHPFHLYQRIACELVFGRRSRMNAVIVLLAYPVYRFVKRNIFRIR